VPGRNATTGDAGLADDGSDKAIGTGSQPRDHFRLDRRTSLLPGRPACTASHLTAQQIIE